MKPINSCALPSSVIFDMDGVLVDSEPVINAAAIRGLQEFGVAAQPEDFTPFIGTGEDRYIGGVSEKYGVPYQVEMKHRVYAIYLEIVAQTLGLYPGVHDLLAGLRREGFTLALASSADPVKIEANLRVAGISPALFAAIVSGDDVDHKKPAPDIYLAAAARIGVAPIRCIVVEDAVNGVRAAKAAGMRCVAVTTSFPAETLRAEAPDALCQELSEVYARIMAMVTSPGLP